MSRGKESANEDREDVARRARVLKSKGESNLRRTWSIVSSVT
jgi:hypothetical protein